MAARPHIASCACQATEAQVDVECPGSTRAGLGGRFGCDAAGGRRRGTMISAPKLAWTAPAALIAE